MQIVVFLTVCDAGCTAAGDAVIGGWLHGLFVNLLSGALLHLNVVSCVAL